MSDLSYAVQLAQKLIRCPSITPEEAGTLDLLEEELTKLGFNCTRLAFGDGKDRIDNLYAEFGEGPAHFAFAGHVDVVPVGRAEDWQFNPFQAEISDGFLYGRGAADMKSGIAAFISAIRQWQESSQKLTKISLIITGDEEKDAINGTIKIMEWTKENNIYFDHCIVGEPTSNKNIGDKIKIGRRGSINFYLKVKGIQGHTANSQRAENPAHHLITLLKKVISNPIDKGNEYDQIAELVEDKVKGIVCLGVDNEKIKSYFSGRKDEIKETKSTTEAVRLAARMAGPGDVVLLSPACASFDLFKNYEDRGDQFRMAVKELIGTKTASV